MDERMICENAAQLFVIDVVNLCLQVEVSHVQQMYGIRQIEPLGRRDQFGDLLQQQTTLVVRHVGQEAKFCHLGA